MVILVRIQLNSTQLTQMISMEKITNKNMWSAVCCFTQIEFCCKQIICLQTKRQHWREKKTDNGGKMHKLVIESHNQ